MAGATARRKVALRSSTKRKAPYSGFSSESQLEISASSARDNVYTANADKDDDSDRVAPRKRTKVGKDSTSSGSKASQRLKSVEEEIPESQYTEIEYVNQLRKNFTHKNGLAGDLPPLHDLDEIFKHITMKAVDNKIQYFIDCLRGRKLRVATMCSGTESPILALEMVISQLKKMGARSFEFKHLFSAEIVEFKQAYIERNFHPPILFKDVKELHQKEAHTAYGAKCEVPSKPDLLVAGFSCVDYSNLNNWRKTFGQRGESDDTLRAILAYCEVHRPRIAVLENLGSAPWPQIGQAFNRIGYLFRSMKVDTKDFYLPQTRERGYALCIQMSLVGNEKQLLDEWASMFMSFKRRASSPFTDFIEPDDDVIEKRKLERIRRPEPKTSANWSLYKIRHADVRRDTTFGNGKPITHWQDGGKCQPATWMDRPWFFSQVERVWDTIDVNHLRTLVNEGYDNSCKVRCIDISQGIDRDTDNRPMGIIGCITPCGMLYNTARGGLIQGRELLALQGMPLSRLSLTRETQAQIQDLAGNAMSTTVVASAMLSALIVLRSVFMILQPDESSLAIEQQRNENLQIPSLTNSYLLTSRTFEAQENFSNKFLRLAGLTASLCSCEGPDGVGNYGFYQCLDCKETACSACVVNPVHNYKPIPISQLKLRIKPIQFRDMLSWTLPAIFILPELLRNDYRRMLVSCASNQDCNIRKVGRQLLDAAYFALQDKCKFKCIKRSCTWKVIYDGCRTLVHLMIDHRGFHGVIWAKPSPEEPCRSYIREVLRHPIAKFNQNDDWKISVPLSVKEKIIRIRGSGKLIPSYNTVCGLSGQELDQKVWSHIIVEAGDEAMEDLQMDIRGRYERIPNCGGALQSLHRRVDSPNERTLFFFLDQRRLGPSQLDSWVFSTDIRRKTDDLQRDVIFQLDNKWTYQELLSSPLCLVLGSHRPWVSAGKHSIQGCDSQVGIKSRLLHSDIEMDLKSSSCYDCYVPLMAVGANIFPGASAPWKQSLDWSVVEMSNYEEMSNFAWLWARFMNWSPRTNWGVVKNARFEICQRCSPQKPKMAWTVIRGKERPIEDPVDCARCERDYKLRPQPFRLFSKMEPPKEPHGNTNGHICIGLNVKTLLQRACKAIAHRREVNTPTEFYWRLTHNDASDIIRPVSFRVLNNNGDPEARQPPNFKIQLRQDQLRSLQWVLRRESDDMEAFPEEEVEEAILKPLNWRAEAKVVVYRKTRGGILADQVGFGKTAVILGLKDFQHEKDVVEGREPCENAIPLHATCIVVPEILFEQWRDEIGRFLGWRYNVLGISNTKTMSSLKTRDFEKADIVLVSWTVFTSAPYFKRLEEIAGGPSPPKAKNVRIFEAWFDDVLSSIEAQVQTLQTDGSEAYLEAIRQKRDSIWGTDAYNRYLPSRRLRGRAIIRAVTDEPLASPSIEGAHSSNVPITEKDSNDKSSSADPMREYRKNFGVADDGRTPLSDIKGTVLHMYRFQRLIVDEFTYLNPDLHALLATLKARSRWILSGTPPIRGFAAAEGMSGLINVFLGRVGDEDYEKSKYKRSESENFHFFKDVTSEGWHIRRSSLGQKFIDFFMRQNYPNIPLIKWEAHYEAVTLSAVERILYLELKLYFESYNPQARMEKKEKYSHDQRGRITEIVKTCKTPEECLVKRCSGYDDFPEWSSASEAITTVQKLIKHRQNEVNQVVADISTLLNALSWLYHQLEQDDSRFDALTASVASNDYGDKDISTQAHWMIVEAMTSYNKDGWRDFWLAPGPLPTIEAGSMSDSEPNTEKEDHENDDEGYHEYRSGKQKLKKKKKILDKKERLAPLPEGKADLEKGLREWTNKVRVNILAWVERSRSLRFSQSAYAFQNGNGVVQCDGCGVIYQKTSSNEHNVLGKCGHVVCTECLQKTQKDMKCSIKGCRAAADKKYAIPGSYFCMSQLVHRPVPPGGSKIRALLGLLKNNDNIPEGDQVILFIQFKEDETLIKDAFDAQKISYVHVGTQRARNKIQQFSALNKRVAILQLGTENAAGLNLQSANHVIFFGTFAATNLYEYQSAMTQASGRVIRFGQQKEVHIWHLFTLNTIEVGILQMQDGRTLVRRSNGGYELVPDGEVRSDDRKGFEVPAFEWK
ncbi:putative SNF2 family helicase [Talaromyces proteolyticus]|uniref:SNF2 family helicase n=1 Tax=Talaromyces proteolyticus TaxID=1131652 RepID=A0AAD4Q5P7_9EURO|nr:putative SNF2 family helicase [Talaromyces proteolyticus]KAH8704773.1 putative SNF2 family helicase [Talaromyces proteolyticus]